MMGGSMILAYIAARRLNYRSSAAYRGGGVGIEAIR